MKYIFLHIPKNGGSTLQHIIDAQYPKHQIFQIGENEREKRIEEFKRKHKHLKRFIKVVKGGHFSFGLHKYFSKPENVKYFAMLRNPIYRTLSYYHFVSRTPKHYLYKKFKDEDLTLENFLNREDLYQEVNNGQTKLLCGLDQLNDCSFQDFKNAKYNLENHFFFVGVMEYYLETLFFLKMELNWDKPIRYRVLNINKQKDYNIDKSLEDRIKELNKFDLDIYVFYKGFYLLKSEFISQKEISGGPARKVLELLIKA